MSELLLWRPEWTDRFDDRIRKVDQHWLWVGYVDTKDGYGRFKPLHAERAQLAHRLAYVRWIGPIPDEFPIIDHLNHPFNLRRCVRPECLEAITHAENTRRGLSPAGQNARLTHCPRCGSEFNATNAVFRDDGERRCRICRRRLNAEYKARRKARESMLVLA